MSFKYIQFKIIKFLIHPLIQSYFNNFKNLTTNNSFSKILQTSPSLNVFINKRVMSKKNIPCPKQNALLLSGQVTCFSSGIPFLLIKQKSLKCPLIKWQPTAQLTPPTLHKTSHSK